MVAERTLLLRELNRATLARQMLLQREAAAVPDAVERLVGLQAQLPVAPYVALWTRLREFRREDLAALIEHRAVVKATLMRATLHLFTAADYVRLRGALQPALERASGSIAKRRGQELDLDQLLASAREYLADQPRSFAEISEMLAERFPGGDVGSLRYTVRTHLPLVQVPADTRWSYPGNPKFALADAWLGQPIPDENRFPDLVRRYLAAFGPAAVADLQTWSGLPALKARLEPLKPELVTYRDERGRELLDLPDLPLPDPDTPAPERFLPDFDNLLLSHQDRTRVIAEPLRVEVFLSGLRVAPTFLVDGFVAGRWKIEKTKNTAALLIEPLVALTPAQRDRLAAEGEALVRFVESEAQTYDVRFVDARALRDGVQP